MQPSQSMIKNRLLGALAAEDYDLLKPYLERTEFGSGEVLAEAGARQTRCIFPETAIGSIIARSPMGDSAESGLVGCEGLIGHGVLLDDPVNQFHTIMQVPGHGLVIASDRLKAAADHSRALRSAMLRYTQALFIQTAYTVQLNTNASVEERLARWLLMCHDRIEGDEMALTHEFLSVMLAVRRPSVTVAMHVLEGERFLRARRARITIIDRAGLQEYASDAYGPAEEAYERLIGPLRRLKIVRGERNDQQSASG